MNLRHRRGSAAGVAQGIALLLVATFSSTLRADEPQTRPVSRAAVAPPGAIPADADLSLLLSRLDRVASLYRDAALEFSCQETINDTAQAGRSHRLEYLYVYDERNGFQDFRTQGRGSAKHVRPEDLGLELVLARSYSWAFIFLGGTQALHRYEFEGPDPANPAIVRIRFEPVPPYREGINDWFGTAWIERETLQILRVEAMKPADRDVEQRFQRALGEASRTAPLLRSERYAFTMVSTEFSVEKNGMRFPGKTQIRTVRRRIRGGAGDDRYHESEIRSVQQVYTGYEFFSVRTREEIHDRIFGVNEEQP